MRKILLGLILACCGATSEGCVTQTTDECDVWVNQALPVEPLFTHLEKNPDGSAVVNYTELIAWVEYTITLRTQLQQIRDCYAPM